MSSDSTRSEKVRGYILVLQWYCDAKHLSYFAKPEEMKGDAAAIRDILGYSHPKIHEQEPACPIGHIVFRVEDDGSLVLHKANYDSSG